MFSTKLLRMLVAVASIVLLNATISFAVSSEDAGAAGVKAADKLNKSMEKAGSDLSAALKGDQAAIERLVTEYAVPAVIALAVLFIAYLVASFIGRIVGNLVSQRVDKTLGKFVGKMVKNVLMLVVVLGVLGKFGVDVTSFAAILAAMGFAVGMAMQGTLSNFAAGIMLLIFRPFKIDDYIVVAGTEGTVEEIDLFTTRLNTLDNRHVIVPNGEIFGSQMENFSRNEFRRVDVNVGADYSADIESTRTALSRAVSNIRGGVTEPAPQVYLVDLGDSSVNWQCRVWCRPSDYWGVRQELTQSAKECLDEANISIPFPQMDVNVVGKLLAKAS